MLISGDARERAETVSRVSPFLMQIALLLGLLNFLCLLRLPTIDAEFAVDATTELQRLIQAHAPIGVSVLVALGIGDVRERVVLDVGAIALLAAQQRPGFALAFNDVVANGDGFKIATG